MSDVNFNQINFSKLEANSLYAVKFSDYWTPNSVTRITKMLNEHGECYNIKFAPIFYGMEIANEKKMNNFIEISATNSLQRNVIINLNNVTSIIRYTPTNKEEYWINLVGDESYRIDKEQYEAIKAKLIDNDSKE